MRSGDFLRGLLVCGALLLMVGCASSNVDTYVDPMMDFGAIQTVAVMPFNNLTKDDMASARVRDNFIGTLLATQAVYVLPTGEVARGISRVGMANPTDPSIDDVVNLSNILKVDAIFLGTLKEYGEVRSGSTTANVISLSLKLIETETGRVVWTASSTVGGIGTMDRLFGGGGEAMNEVTQAAVDDLINKLFE